MEYSIGDIVFLHNNSFKYPDGTVGGMHPFVIFAIDKGEFELLPASYSALLVSSKSSQSGRKYNETLEADSINRLLEDSHVKCDFLYKNISSDDILHKMGEVTKEQLIKFIELYFLAKSKGELQQQI